MTGICTCKDTKCPLHPDNHDKGCTPCIRKNLKLGEIPNCFFDLVTDDQDGRDCSEILIQIAAVRSAINNIGKIILKDHIDHCVVDAIETGTVRYWMTCLWRLTGL